MNWGELNMAIITTGSKRLIGTKIRATTEGLFVYDDDKNSINTLEYRNVKIIKIIANGNFASVKSNNCIRVFGNIRSAKVGNSCTCLGKIDKANAHNRVAYCSNLEVLTYDQELAKRREGDRKFKENTLKYFTQSGIDFESEPLCKPLISKPEKVSTQIFTIDGDLSALWLEIVNRSVLLEVHGDINKLDVVNALECKGNITKCEAGNMIYLPY